ncbi:MAG: sigma-70 family RNA polymerase sigma factor [Patescibacteria group bacterium]
MTDPRTDAELVQSFRAGDEVAFTMLVQRYLSSVYTFLYRMTGESGLAEDATQETFVKVWQKLNAFDARKPFKTWLFTIAKHAVIDQLRKKRPILFSVMDEQDRDFDFAATIPDERPLPSTLLDREEVVRYLAELLCTVSVQARAVILMHETEDMTFEEIAVVVGEPMNTVKSRYRRTMAFLRKTVVDRYTHLAGKGPNSDEMHQ